MIRDILELDLKRVLRSGMNADELRRLLDVIKSVDFASLNLNWMSRGRIDSLSPGRRCPGADWFYDNPWAKRVANADDVQAYCSTEHRPIPDGHPRDWKNAVVSDGWGPNLFV